MNPPPDSVDAAGAEDALFALILAVAERVTDLAASADRSARLAELVNLCAALGLFARATEQAALYVSALS